MRGISLAIEKVDFFKAHGAGNDFVVLDEKFGVVPGDLSRWAVAFCCRRTGVGADGVLVIRRHQNPVAMECWNSDGSRAEACGNGLRVITRILSEQSPVSEVGTDAGTITVESLRDADGQFLARTILGPVRHSAEVEITVSGKTVHGIPANVGNPHLVFAISDFPGDDPVRHFGPGLEVCVPDRVNVGFHEIVSRTHLKLRVWERGCGETLACGTGAAAAVRVLQARGLLAEQVRVEMPGGDLQLRSLTESPDHVEICGPARINYRGSLRFDTEQVCIIDFEEQVQETI